MQKQKKKPKSAQEMQKDMMCMNVSVQNQNKRMILFETIYTLIKSFTKSLIPRSLLSGVMLQLWKIKQRKQRQRGKKYQKNKTQTENSEMKNRYRANVNYLLKCEHKKMRIANAIEPSTQVHGRL